ncbi:MAG: NTP transferase domain-containing protein, partial [Chloroflexi bacterium]|nr:NTP transferase domain-containing protein [Chloroflexota bacterium]
MISTWLPVISAIASAASMARSQPSSIRSPEAPAITCPIGNPALGKTPHEIAIGVAAQLLSVFHGAAPSVETPDVLQVPGRRAGLILAGGASSRMGQWKGGLIFDGLPLVDAHARALTSAGADIWKAIYPDSVREEAERIIAPGHRIMNPTPEAPLFASLQLGLRSLIQEASDRDSILLVPV